MDDGDLSFPIINCDEMQDAGWRTGSEEEMRWNVWCAHRAASDEETAHAPFAMTRAWGELEGWLCFLFVTLSLVLR